MGHNWKRLVGCLLIVVLLTTLGTACDDGGDEGLVTISIGEIDDFTGPAGQYMTVLSWGMQDVARYYNEQELIPGAKIQYLTYDTRLDPSRATGTARAFARDRGQSAATGALASSASCAMASSSRSVPQVVVPSGAMTTSPAG